MAITLNPVKDTYIYLATLIVPQTNFAKMQVEYLGQLSNSIKPKRSST